jgi:hypothetical protein
MGTDAAMNRSLAAALVLVTSTLAAGTARAEDAPMGAPAPHGWFALDLEAGAAVSIPQGQWAFHPRVRAGASLVRNWQFWSLTATAELFNTERLAFGLLGEVADIQTGLWGYLGGSVSTSGVPGATAGGGWRIFGLEAQVHFGETVSVVPSVMLRLPLGAIGYALFAPRRSYRMPLPAGYVPPSSEPPAAPAASAPAEAAP